MWSTVISSSLSTGKKNYTTDKKYLEIQTATGIVRSTKEARVCIQEVGTNFNVKFVEDPPSVLSLRPCDDLGYS